MPILDAPLTSVDEYVAFFSQQQIPVLKQSLRELDALKNDIDTINGRQLADVALGDPLMALRLLLILAKQQRKSLPHDITTIDHAIIMMGVTPFFDAFANLDTLEDRLADQPAALLGALKLVARSRRAAAFARDWAILRHDMEVEEITAAALLRNATEIMCWIFAPSLALEVTRMQTARPTVRSATVQRLVFGTTARDIQAQLIREWRMPALLITLLDETDVNNPRAQTVYLATRLARHLSKGWNDPALNDDFIAIEKLTRLNREQLLHRLSAPPDAIKKLSTSQPEE